MPETHIMSEMSFSLLPTEILDQIFSYFCPHCTVSDGELKSTHLIDVAQTCNRFKRVALPILYHRVHAKKSGIFSAFRTLHNHPERREWVREVYLETSRLDANGDQFMTLQDVEDLNRCVAEQGSLEEGWETQNDVTEETLNTTNEVYQSERENLVQLATAILPTMTPRIEHLVVRSDTWYWPSYRQNSCPRLKTLRLEPTDDDESTVSSEILESILPAAPQLTTINVTALTNVNWRVGHPRVHTFELERSELSFDDVGRLMDNFPCLERFKLEVETQTRCWLDSKLNNITPRKLEPLLLSRSQTLRHLSLDFTQWPWGEEGASFQRLHELDLLETLGLPGAALVDCRVVSSEWKNVAVLERVKRQPNIVDMLPPSLQELEILPPSSHMVKPMLALAGHCPERFPELRKISVRVEGPQSNWIRVQTMFAKYGIPLTISDPKW